MKKKILMFAVMCLGICNAQNKQVRERVEELQESIDGLEQIDKMYDVQLVIKPGDSDFDEHDTFAFTKSVKPKDYKNVVALMQEKKIRQKILAPYSVLAISDTDMFDWAAMLGVDNFFFDEHPEYIPKLSLATVYFADGTSKSAKELLVPDQKALFDEKGTFDDEFFVIKSTKSVVAIDYYVSLKSTQVETLVFNPNKSENTLQNETVRLKSWSGKEVGFQFPENVYKNILGIDAVYKDKFLSEKGSNSTSLPPLAKRKQLQALSTFYVETVKKANKNTFKNVKELDDYLVKNQPELDTLTPNDVLKNYYFSGPPSEIRMYFPKKETLQIDQLVKNERTEEYGNPKDRKVAADFKTQKLGVMNAQGEWLVKPEYEYLYNNNDYFFSARKDSLDQDSYFWLSEKGDKWQKIEDIQIYRSDIHGDFLMVEKGTNGPKGLFNIKTGKLVIPTVNDNIYEKNGLFIVEYQENTLVLDANAKTILEGKYKSVRIDPPFIYVLPQNGDNFNGYQVYNYQGKNISSDFLSDGGWDAGSDMTLVYKKGKGEYERHYYYINTNGQVVITVDPNKYERAERFTNNRALWKEKDGNYGFVNEKGKIVIPFDLIEAGEFRGKYAVVKREIPGKGVWIGLIDANGKPHTQFEQWPYYIHYNEKEKIWNYTINDTTTYDGDGNLLPKK